MPLYRSAFLDSGVRLLSLGSLFLVCISQLGDFDASKKKKKKKAKEEDIDAAAEDAAEELAEKVGELSGERADSLQDLVDSSSRDQGASFHLACPMPFS